jgi:hypothetical protein
VKPVFSSSVSAGMFGPTYRCATACAMAAKLQATIASANPVFVPSQSITRPMTRRPIAYASVKLKMM